MMDEYGGTAGLITLNDILRKILGEFKEEAEERERGFVRLSENKFLVHGDIPLDQFSRYIHRQVSDPENETIAGFLLNFFNHIPSENQEIEIDDIQYVIKSVDETKIQQVLVTLLEPGEQANSHSSGEID